MRTRNVLFAVSAIAALGYLLKKLSESSAKPQAVDEYYRHMDEVVDSEVDDSFPASDPPSWTGGHIH